MDQFEQELEERIRELKSILETPHISAYLILAEIVSIEGEQHTLEERLYQYRLAKEADG